MTLPTIRILVIDDDPNFILLIRHQLKDTDYEIHEAAEMSQVQEQLSKMTFGVILLDYQLGKDNGAELLVPIRRMAPMTPVIMVTGNQSVDLVVQVMRLGAYDFIPKPFEQSRVLASLHRAVEHHRLIMRVHDLENTYKTSSDTREMIGESPQMHTVYRVIDHVAPTTTNVMIVGESGTGKELVARAIHNNSPRADQPFVALNMAALPRELVESTLFGHQKGAFTGADQNRIGACEEADGGTLFLDEICEMPLELQPKLLRFLQERIFRKVGATKDQHADVRILSATNRDPLLEVQENRMRADLYYRLNVVPLELPALRDRAGDVELLAMHAVKDFSRRHGKSFTSIEYSALELLQGYDWPGNVRQLMHMIERMVVLNDGEELQSHMLPKEVMATQSQRFTSLPKVDDQPGSYLEETLTAEKLHDMQQDAKAIHEPMYTEDEIRPMEDLEKEAIRHALEVCNGSAARAAAALGMSEATIYRKIKVYDLQGIGKKSK